MNRFIRNGLAVFYFAVLTATMSNCFLLAELGVPVPGYVPGATVKDKVAESAPLGLAFGVALYCGRFTNSNDCNTSLSSGRNEGMGLAFLITPDQMPIDDQVYYGNYQATACADAVFFNFFFLPYIYLQAKETTTSGGKTLQDPSGKIKESVVVTAAMAGSACQAGLNSSEADAESGDSESESESEARATRPSAGVFTRPLEL